ncbi:MAG: TetR/AcrR family transcriptional regulator [Alphaproteobacteria bacterium]|nr:TetR/AcrR family transcriptional regulator [Alphaproteobacteria bacterium]
MKSTDCPIVTLGKAVKKLTRSEQKRAAILEAASNVFLTKGFETASMDEIASIAGVSKRTVYSHFQSKEKLYAGVMTGMCQGKREDILGSNEPGQDYLDQEGPIEELLCGLGERFLREVFNDESISLMRILIGKSDADSEMGQEFFNNGPILIINAIRDFFIKTNAEGKTAVDNPQIAAECLLASFLGARHIQCLVHAETVPTEEEIRAHVRETLGFMMKGIALRSSNDD